MMLVDWDNMPTVRVVLDQSHPDYDYQAHMSMRDAKHLYGKAKGVHWFEVADSREGWAQAVEMMEVMAFEKTYRDDMLIIDFSPVRASNEPIMGMQGRPSSGPVPMMQAIEKIAKIKGAKMPRWLQALYIDHFLADTKRSASTESTWESLSTWLVWFLVNGPCCAETMVTTGATSFGCVSAHAA